MGMTVHAQVTVGALDKLGNTVCLHLTNTEQMTMA